jgi:maltose alpha-D-glucosyltransferase/alpha-amylase
MAAERWPMSRAPGPARYFVPLALAFDDDEKSARARWRHVAVSKVRQQAKMGVLADAMADEPFCRALVEAIGSGGRCSRPKAAACASPRARPTPAWPAKR